MEVRMDQLKDGDLLSRLLGIEGTDQPGDIATQLFTMDIKDVLSGGAIELISRLPQRHQRRLDLVCEVAKRYSGNIGPLPTISCPAETVPYLYEIKDAQKEHFVCLFLNARNQVNHKEVISTGSLSASIVHPREVFKAALEHTAASIILAHNHPSGDVSPSKDDLELTRRLVKAGQLMGIEVMDHIIISKDGWLSLKEKGLM